MATAMKSGSARQKGGRGRRGRLGPALLPGAALVACGALLLAADARPGPAGAPTRADLDLLRRKVALLESELALARSRKPYLVVDAPGKRLRYALLGMTMREIPSSAIQIEGLQRTDEGGAPGPHALAGIATLKEKERDPRLTPLTPEQIEAGAADENVADALPPEAPADFDLRCAQPIVLRVEGAPEKKGAWTGTFSGWGRLWPRSGAGGERVALRLAVHLDETAAREIYRSLLPGAHLLLVAPVGYFLPDAGQESPRNIRPGRPARPPAAQPGPSPQGVPFRIPPPVAETPADGAAPAGGGETGPAVESSPSPPEEAAPAPTPRPDDPPAREAPPDGPAPGGGPSSPPGTGEDA